MGRRKWRTPFTAAEARLIWQRWRAGARLEHIAAELGRSTPAVTYLVVRRGGIAPSARHRAERALRLAEREEISRGLAQGDSVRGIAVALGRAPSTISREIRRHGGATEYRASSAEAEAWQRARRPKVCRLAREPRLCQLVEARLRGNWSPQQIAAWLQVTYPDEPAMQVSHETIYRTLYLQARGALKKELVAHLRRSRGYRQSRAAAHAPDRRAQIPDAISISERPPTVEDRAVPGHWEGDLLLGNKHSQIATLVERHSRYVMLLRLPNRETATVVKALIRRVQHLPAGLMQSLTWDRGLEMAQHKRFSIATEVQVFFCDPRSPWQRGSNENTNGLLRQYFPKGMDLTHLTQRHLDTIAQQLNTRPRQTLGWRTPAAVLAATVAPTG